MSANDKSFTLTITPEMERELNELKRSGFHNASRAEMCRHILEAGIKAARPESVEKPEKPMNPQHK